MTLEQYYDAIDAKKSNIFAPEEVGSLRESIRNFFDGFKTALKKDMEYEDKDNVYGLKRAFCTNAYLVENKKSMLGFALYLVDFRGFNDNILREGGFGIWDFSYIIFKFHHPFEEAHFRLIEVCNDIYLAEWAPCYDNVAAYILTHFDEYANKKNSLQNILKELEALKERCKKNKVAFKTYTSPYILYKVIKRKLSTFKSF